MMELRLAQHSVRVDTVIVEIWDGGQLMGAIYPTETGVHIHSKYLREAGIVAGALEMPTSVHTCMVRLK
jgi:hypothetical protein